MISSPSFTVNLISFFSTASGEYLTSIVKKIAQLQESGKSINITWLHQADENDEDESFELGKSLEAEARIKFQFVEIAK